MRPSKSNFAVYTPISRLSSLSRISKPANILDLVKKNKEELKKEKMRNFYTITVFVVSIFLIGTFIYI